MKPVKFIILITCLFSLHDTNGQHMQVANPIIIPQNPEAGDSVFVCLRSWTSSITMSHGYVTNRIADSFEIYHCVHGFILTAIKDYNDTLFLGVLDTGTYVVHFTIYATSRGDTCEYLDPKDSTTTFKVNPPTGILFNPHPPLILYPNPARDVIKISGIGSRSVTQVNCIPFIGGRCSKVKFEFRDDVMQIDVKDLSPGYYVLQILDDNWVYRKPILISR